MSQWIDVSQTIRPGMAVWPGDEEVRFWRTEQLEESGEANVTAFSTTAHVGTHVDAPAHFLQGGGGVEALPLDVLIGQVRVIAVQNARKITREELLTLNIQHGQRLLFKTPRAVHSHGNEFYRDYVYLTPNAAALFVEIGIRLVGIDTPSVGGFYEGDIETHLALLKAGIVIVEGMDLSEVDEGDYEMICLPLKLEGADGSPARVLLRPLK